MMMTANEAAEYLGISPGTLRNMRSMAFGPKSAGRDEAKLGKPLLFAQEDLDEWKRWRRLSNRLELFRWRSLGIGELTKVAEIVGLEVSPGFTGDPLDGCDIPY